MAKKQKSSALDKRFTRERESPRRTILRFGVNLRNGFARRARRNCIIRLGNNRVGGRFARARARAVYNFDAANRVSICIKEILYELAARARKAQDTPVILALGQHTCLGKQRVMSSRLPTSNSASNEQSAN